jgi:hypothetical protein
VRDRLHKSTAVADVHYFQVTAALCSTVEECWDHDPEARLSAECVEERLRSMWEILSLSTANLYESFAESASLSEPREDSSLVAS